MKYAAIVPVFLALAACAQPQNETEGTYDYEGQSYRMTTEQITQDGKTFSQRTIYVGVTPVTCSATDDLDCDGKIEDLPGGDGF